MKASLPHLLLVLAAASSLLAQDTPPLSLESPAGRKLEATVLGSPEPDPELGARIILLFDPASGIDTDTRKGLGEAFAVAELQLIVPKVTDESGLLDAVDALRSSQRLRHHQLTLVTTPGTYERSPTLFGPRRFEFAHVVLTGPVPATPPTLWPWARRHPISTPEDRAALAVDLASRAQGKRDHEAVARALDSLHEAAARADEDAYFSLFSPESVFLGTDASERWELEAFKKFALPYFQRRSAWIFVPTERHITLDPTGQVAWFDERVHSASYGECRGTGVLRQIEGQWRIALYDLTVPVPNELLDDVVQGIRSRQDSPSPRKSTVAIWIVRHAEKDTAASESNPPLSILGRARAQALLETLRSLPVTEIYATEFLRTQETVKPLAEALGKSVTQVDAGASSSLAFDLRNKAEGHYVIASHSNVIPKLIAELGGPSDLSLEEADYDNLFLITLDTFGRTTYHRLHYGQKAP